MKVNILSLFLACVLISCSGKEETNLGDKMTPKGFSYSSHVANKADKAQLGDLVYFHMEVVAKDSTLYDSRKDPRTRGRLQSFPLDPVKVGDPNNPLLDALPLMAEGDSISIFYPVDSIPPLPPGFEEEKHVKYNVAMKAIVSADDLRGAERVDEIKALVAIDLAAKKAGKLKDLINLTDDYQIYVHEEGTGVQSKTGDYVKVHYYGVTYDEGEKFDGSFSRSSPFVFRLNSQEVIEGWDVAMSSLKRGTKATLFIPSKLAYGDQVSGPIKANADLVFYLEIL